MATVLGDQAISRGAGNFDFWSSVGLDSSFWLFECKLSHGFDRCVADSHFLKLWEGHGETKGGNSLLGEEEEDSVGRIQETSDSIY